MANPEVVVDFVAKTAGLQRGLSQASNQTKGFGNSLKGLGKAGALAAGAAGVGALVAVTKIGIDEFTQASKVSAQTAAAIKSTGGAAGVTSKQVADLAQSLMKKSGVDDEAIQSGENLLLTFTRVQNKAGEGNDIFNQATKAMLDMSVALGQDTTQSAMQLGKALNDPVKGMTALRRVGVTFTDQQQKQVKAMVASGKTMEAQKLILAELTKEFGGSAEAVGKTLPGQLSILRESFNNFAGDLIAKLAPALQATITWLRENWPQISAVIQQTWAAIQPTIQAMIDLIVSVVQVIRENWSTIGPIVKSVADIIILQFRIIADAIKIIAALLRGDWSAAWAAMKDLVVSIVEELVAQVKARLLILKAVAELVWTGIQALAELAWGAIQSGINAVTNAIMSELTTSWNTIKSTLTTIWTALQTAATTTWNAIKTAVTTTTTAVQTAVTTTWNAIKTAVTTTSSAIQTAVTTAWNTIKTNVTTALNTLKTAVTTAWNGIKTAVTTVVGPIKTAVESIASAFKTPATAANTMLSGIKTAFGAIAGAINAVVGAVGAAAQKVANAITAPINAAKAVVNGILSKFNALSIPGFSVHVGIPGPIPDIDFSWGGMDLPDIPLLAKGGVVSKPTLVMAGEGRGREIFAPEALLRSIVNERATEVRVFIGDVELKGLVRSEIVRSDERIARTLLAGATA